MIPPPYASEPLFSTSGLQPIAEDNRGHQMLCQSEPLHFEPGRKPTAEEAFVPLMAVGWAGGALGRSGADEPGIVAPIEVEMRRKREGLGTPQAMGGAPSARGS